MQPALHDPTQLDPEARAFYVEAMDLLAAEKLPFLVGGAYALARYTGIVRHTKDFDVFVRPVDCEAVLQAFANRGWRSERTFPHWLGKAYHGENFLDVIFSSGNGIAEVDDGWFEHAVAGTVLDRAVLLCPAEEILWSKGLIMERERYDGADVVHLLRACAPKLDWRRLLQRFGPNWRVLLSHLILFGYIYPTERSLVPHDVLQEMLARLLQEQKAPPGGEKMCQGTLLSREQYLVDVNEWGYRDARLTPRSTMNEGDVAQWTAAIGTDMPPGEPVAATEREA